MNSISPKRYGEDEDEDQDLDEILRQLSGEVDDFAGKQLQDPDKTDGRFEGGPPAKGTVVTITVGPGSQGPSDKGPEDEENAGGIDKESKEEEREDEDHDPIAHILGLCRGGCTEG